jgi:hypothetical protein
MPYLATGMRVGILIPPPALPVNEERGRREEGRGKREEEGDENARGDSRCRKSEEKS